MNKQDKYLWDTIRLLACRIRISKRDLDENFDEIVQQLFAEFFIMIYDELRGGHDY
jgi:hypothetical protein